MTETIANTMFEELQNLVTENDADKAFEKLIESLEEQGEDHKVFDAKMMQAKHKMGLPLTKPTSFQDVPEENRNDFEEVYKDQAREIGQKLIEKNQLMDAWMYFRVLGDSSPVKKAFEEMPLPEEYGDDIDELIQLALYENVHPVKGLAMMLKLHGMCNTITTLDQVAAQLSLEDRRDISVILVNQMYEELKGAVQRNVEQRVPLLPPGQSLAELIAGREWLFEDENYHTDISHLNAVVRHARALNPDQPEMKLVLELSMYGENLAPALQYPGDPPFQNFYEAHTHYFNIVLGNTVDEGLAYFKEILANEPDLPDQQLIAYVMVDLLMRIDRNDEALELANTHLANTSEEAGFSYSDFCKQIGRMDALADHAKKESDPVLYLGALLTK